MGRILVVDDSPSIRLLLTRRLEMAGHSVIDAADGNMACQAMESTTDGDRAALILLDAMLPDTKGPALLNRLKALNPTIPVVVVSAVNSLANDLDWQAADGHVTKPIDFDDLLNRVETLLSGDLDPDL
ncbi:MAG: response regulator [Solirubrobacterales bacterium]